MSKSQKMKKKYKITQKSKSQKRANDKKCKLGRVGGCWESAYTLLACGMELGIASGCGIWEGTEKMWRGDLGEGGMDFTKVGMVVGGRCQDNVIIWLGWSLSVERWKMF